MSETMEEDPLLHADVQEMESSALITTYTVLAYGVVLLAIVGGAVYYFFGDKLIKKEPKKKAADVDHVAATNTVGLEDVTYLAKQLAPESTHLDVLMAVASTPENIAYGLQQYEIKEETRRERIKEDLEESKKKKTSDSGKKATSKDDLFNLDDDGWADDDDDDERAKAAAKAEEEKKKEREELQKAVGKQKIKLEGIDEGVIGQKWVENTLAGNGVWPPKDLGLLNGRKFEYQGKQVSPLDHPGLRRNLCMITGRLNSIMLNSHPELRKSLKCSSGRHTLHILPCSNLRVHFSGSCIQTISRSIVFQRKYGVPWSMCFVVGSGPSHRCRSSKLSIGKDNRRDCCNVQNRGSFG